jgi:hypothetical protein
VARRRATRQLRASAQAGPDAEAFERERHQQEEIIVSSDSQQLHFAFIHGVWLLFCALYHLIFWSNTGVFKNRDGGCTGALFVRHIDLGLGGCIVLV